MSEAVKVPMASGTAKMFGCPFCGFRISPSDEACSRCGKKFAGTTKFECPFCGELVERGALSCPACHVNYTEFRERAEARGGDDSIDSLLTEIIRLESASVKKEDKKLSCPECSWLLDGTEEECPKCGHSFAEDVSFQCPVCGSEIRADAVQCPSCGAMFAPESATEEEIASEHQETSNALDEILTHADKESKAQIESDEKLALTQTEGPVKQKTTSMFDRIATAPDQEPKPREVVQTPATFSKPEPMDAPEVTPEPAPQPKPENEEPQPMPETAREPKKTRTRKLKSKPKSG